MPSNTVGNQDTSQNANLRTSSGTPATSSTSSSSTTTSPTSTSQSSSHSLLSAVPKINYKYM